MALGIGSGAQGRFGVKGGGEGYVGVGIEGSGEILVVSRRRMLWIGRRWRG